MVDLNIFLLIDVPTFNAFLLSNNILLTQSDPVYCVTLITANILAWLGVALLALAIKITLRALFKKRGEGLLW